MVFIPFCFSVSSIPIQVLFSGHMEKLSDIACWESESIFNYDGY